MAKVGTDDLDNSTTLESNKSLAAIQPKLICLYNSLRVAATRGCLPAEPAFPPGCMAPMPITYASRQPTARWRAGRPWLRDLPQP